MNILADPSVPPVPNKFPHSIFVTFRAKTPLNGDVLSVLTTDDWKWMRSQKEAYDQLLAPLGIGHCDGFGMGYGELNMTFFTSNAAEMFKAIKMYLIQSELIGYCIRVSTNEGVQQGEDWKVLYP